LVESEYWCDGSELKVVSGLEQGDGGRCHGVVDVFRVFSAGLADQDECFVLFTMVFVVPLQYFVQYIESILKGRDGGKVNRCAFRIAPIW